MLNALQNAERYLKEWQLTVAQLSNSLGQVLPWETVIFGGSIPEGLANGHSDADLLLIGDTVVETGRAVYESDTRLAYTPLLNGLKVQVESIRIGQLEPMVDRMEKTVSAIHDPDATRSVHVFTAMEMRLLHRIRTGVCLQNEDIAGHWRQRLRSEYLPDYMLVHCVAQHFSRREDAIGEQAEGRRESTLWSWKDALSYAAGALLASIGESHPYAKWRVRLLQLHREEIGIEFADPLVHMLTEPRVGNLQEYTAQVVSLCDTLIETALSRRPAVLPVLMALNREIPFVTHPKDEVSAHAVANGSDRMVQPNL